MKFMVEGKSIRMDSKLIGSNIGWYSRFQIVHEMILMCAKHLLIKQLHCHRKEDRTTHLTLMTEPAQQLVYTETSESLEKRLSDLGYLMFGLLNHFPGSLPHYDLLKRVFNEQFIVDKKIVRPCDKKDISAKSVQNPHDHDATFRCKEKQKVKGYITNLTETCDDNSLKLITNVQTKNVSAPDNGFLEKAITDSQENVLSGKIKNVHADGAYRCIIGFFIPLHNQPFIPFCCSGCIHSQIIFTQQPVLLHFIHQPIALLHSVATYATFSRITIGLFSLL
ncbi:MAG: hypothetical protein ABFC90_12285 [Bacteroidales bacterium]